MKIRKFIRITDLTPNQNTRFDDILDRLATEEYGKELRSLSDGGFESIQFDQSDFEAITNKYNPALPAPLLALAKELLNIMKENDLDFIEYL